MAVRPADAVTLFICLCDERGKEKWLTLCLGEIERASILRPRERERERER